MAEDVQSADHYSGHRSWEAIPTYLAMKVQHDFNTRLLTCVDCCSYVLQLQTNQSNSINNYQLTSVCHQGVVNFEFFQKVSSKLKLKVSNDPFLAYSFSIACSLYNVVRVK
jgi:hypothetical protein